MGDPACFDMVVERLNQQHILHVNVLSSWLREEAAVAAPPAQAAVEAATLLGLTKRLCLAQVGPTHH